MIKTILVAATGNEADAAAFAAALSIARPFAAHLDVLHVRLDAASIAAAMITDAGSGGLTSGLIERFEQDAREREVKAKDIFTRFCTEAGVAVSGVPTPERVSEPTAQWHVEVGEEPRWMTSYSMGADLIVAPRPSGEEFLARSTLEAVLFDAGRPLLIPAAPIPRAMPASFERVAIAWKPTPQAARAVALAMPFLMRAKEILVVTVAEQPEERDETDRLVRNLAWHGLTVRAERLKSGAEGAAATLLAAADAKADLVVMGGYGHSRLREWVFGGFTEEVLGGAPLPVLIAH